MGIIGPILAGLATYITLSWLNFDYNSAGDWFVSILIAIAYAVMGGVIGSGLDRG